jgi:hypothetical protein
MWPYLNATICTAIRNNIEPIIQKNVPSPFSGFVFEKLSFGDVPWQVRGVKYHPLYSGVLSLSQDSWWEAKFVVLIGMWPVASSTYTDLVRGLVRGP